jgi:hypothetical protein
MALLTLSRAFAAIHGLLLANALPDVPGTSEGRIRAAGGMRPWLRLALSDKDARALVASGRATWHISALMNPALSESGAAVVTDRDDRPIIIMLDCLSEVSSGGQGGTVHDFLSSVLSRSDKTALMPFIQDFLAMEEAHTARLTPFAPFRMAVLRQVAAASGVVLRDVPAPLGMWRAKSVDTTVTAIRRNPKTAPHRPFHGDVDVVGPDGYRWTLFRAVSSAWEMEPFIGGRIRLHCLGATPGHPGYIDRIEDIDLLEHRKATARVTQTSTKLQPTGHVSQASPGVETVGAKATSRPRRPSAATQSLTAPGQRVRKPARRKPSGVAKSVPTLAPSRLKHGRVATKKQA